MAWTQNSSDVKFTELYRSRGNSFIKIADLTYQNNFVDSQVDGNDSTYRYFVIAIDSCNSSNRSISSDTVTISNLRAETGACRAEVRLAWTPYLDFETAVDSYLVLKLDGIAFIPLATVAARQLSFTDTAVSHGVAAQYRILAYDIQQGDSAFSDSINIIPFKYPDPDTLQTISASVAATGASDGAVILSWSSYNPKDTFARGIRIYELNANGKSLVSDISDLSQTNFLHRNINTSSESHTYQIVTYNLCNVEGSFSQTHKTVQLEAVNNNLSVDLTWSRYKGFAVNAYEIYKSVDGGNLNLMASLAATDSAFTDSLVRCDKQYTYYIRAVGASAVSLSDSVQVTGFDNISPVRPITVYTSVRTSDGANGSIELEFIGNTEANRSSYDVLRAEENGSFQKIFTDINLSADTNKVLLTGLNTATSENRFIVLANDSCGNISDTAALTAPVLLSAKARGDNSNQLNWTSYLYWMQYNYQIQRKKGNGTWRTLATVSAFDKEYLDSFFVACDSQYSYRIGTQNLENGRISFSNQVQLIGKDSIAPTAPTLLYATYRAENNEFDKHLKVVFSDSNFAYINEYQLFASSDGNNFNLLESKLTTNTEVQEFDFESDLLTNGESHFYVLALDSCGNQSVSSQIHRVMQLSSTPQEQSIALDFNNYLGLTIDSMAVWRDGVFLAKLSNNVYVDSPLNCTQSPVYQIVAYSGTHTLLSSSSSNTALDQTAAAVPAVSFISITEDNESIEIKWQENDDFDFSHYRLQLTNQEGEVLLSEENLSSNFLVYDELVDSGICVSLQSVDACENVSELSPASCVMWLNLQQTSEGNSMYWDAYTYWKAGVRQYNVYRNDDDLGWLLYATIDGQTTTYSDGFDEENNASEFTYCYRIEAVDSSANYSAFSNKVCITQEPYFFVPNAFSPNNDALNEQFGLVGLFIESFEIDIYARNGQRVFRTENSQYWDGRIDGNKTAAIGVYVYIIKIKSASGEVYEQTGNVTIISK